MGAAAAVPMVLSVASAGMQAAGQGMAAQGTAAADTYKAEQLDAAAKYGELQATQTNAQMTRNLTTTLGNIDAVRAAARADPTSPTGSSVREYVEEQGTMQKNIKVTGIQQQALMDESNAAYMRSASSAALLGGDIGIASSLLKAGSGALGSMGG
jgi:hypothetical protein